MVYDKQYQRGQASMASGKYKDAANAFTQAIWEASNLGQMIAALHQSAMAYLAAGQPDQAILKNQDALTYAPEIAEHWQLRAAIMQQLGNPALAQEAAAEATLPLATDADWLRRSRALYNAHIFMPAYNAVLHALQMTPQNVDALQLRVLIARQLYDPNDLITAVQALIAVTHQENVDAVMGSPVHPDAFALYNQAVAAIRSQEHQRGAGLMDQALVIEPHYYAALIQKAMLLSEFNRPQEAMAVLDVAEATLAMPACDYGYLLARGDAASKQGNTKVAIQVYQRALQRFPVGERGAGFWNDLINCYSGLTKRMMASTYTKRANTARSQFRVFPNLPLTYPQNSWADGLFRIEHELKALTNAGLRLHGGNTLTFQKATESYNLQCGILDIVGWETDPTIPTLLIRAEVRPSALSPAPGDLAVTFTLLYYPTNISSRDELDRMLVGVLTTAANQIMDSSQKY